MARLLSKSWTACDYKWDADFNCVICVLFKGQITMPSPFPGMNPYWESPHIWEDFHANLAGEIQAMLNPKLRPKYVAILATRVTYEAVEIATKPQIIKPDVSIIQTGPGPHRAEAVAIAPPPLVGQVVQEVPIRLFSVEIRDVVDGSLVTVIEILSPVNKRRGHEAQRAYGERRRALARSYVNLVEIDLLRDGERYPLAQALPDNPYFIFVRRGNETSLGIWPVDMDKPIPVVPVPLLNTDHDVPLAVGQAIDNIYDRAAYDLRIDYDQPPPPPDLPPRKQAWLAEHLIAQNLRQAGVESE
jgi:hypothetical protein